METIGNNLTRIVQLSGASGGSGTWTSNILPNGDIVYTDGTSGTSFTVISDDVPVERISTAQTDLLPGVYEIDSSTTGFTISLADTIGYWKFYNSNKSLDTNAVTLTSVGTQTYTDTAGVQIDGDFLLNVGGKPVNILHTELGNDYRVSIEPSASIPPLFAPNGGWDASTNTVDLNIPTNRVNGSVHYAYYVSVTGTQNLGAGATLFQQGGRIEWYSTTQYNYIAPPSISSGWSLAGNSTTSQSTNFIGTIDNIGFSIRTNNIIRQTTTNAGDTGFGTTTPSAKVDINGSLLLRHLQLSDYAVSGSIGTAAATVNLFSTIVVTQTTPDIVLTIPAPTPNTTGRIVTIINNGLDVVVQGEFIPSGTGAIFQNVGNGWYLLTGKKSHTTTGYVNPGGANSFSPNSGLNTIVGGVSTMPASTVNYSMADGNYVGTISLPSAVGRIGRLSYYHNASSNATLVATNTDLDGNIALSTGRSIHFLASNGRWRWQVAPLATV